MGKRITDLTLATTVQPNAKFVMEQNGETVQVAFSNMINSPSAHALSHATGGSDPITPASIGAADIAHTEHAELFLPEHGGTVTPPPPFIGGIVLYCDSSRNLAVSGPDSAVKTVSYTDHIHQWSDITNKPTTFTPSTHTQAQSSITGLETSLASFQKLEDFYIISGGPELSKKLYSPAVGQLYIGNPVGPTYNGRAVYATPNGYPVSPDEHFVFRYGSGRWELYDSVSNYYEAANVTLRDAATPLEASWPNLVLRSTIENLAVNNLVNNVHVTNLTASKTFLDFDSCKIFHFNTTTQSLCAIFPSSLPDGFNVTLMNTGTKQLRLSAAQLNSITSTIGIKYGGAFVYKDNSQIFANAMLGSSLATVVLNNETEVFSIDRNIPEGWYANGTGNRLRFGNDVSMIGVSAFKGCFSLAGNLTIPNTVGSIGKKAFEECSGFTGNLVIPSSLNSIDEAVFYLCSGFTGNLTIPNSINSIGISAFQGCSGLRSLTFGNTLSSIGGSAFRDCINFRGNLTIPSSVITIDASAFQNCSNFTGSLVFPNSVTSIGGSAFRGCSGFVSLTIPSSVTSIGSSAFQDCTGLVGNLTIPSSVSSIGTSAFRNCSGLTSVDCYVDKTILNVSSSIEDTLITTIRVLSSDPSWTAGPNQTIGGKSNINVIKNLT